MGDLGANVAGGATTMLLVGLALWGLLAVAHWRMFTKAGEKGWKALVPIYSDYTLFKLVWNTRSFWIYTGLALAMVLSMAFSGSYAIVNGQLVGLAGGNMFLGTVTFISSIGLLFYMLMLVMNTATAYGKGNVFAIGLFLLPNVFSLILGFGSAEYRGSQG